MPEPPRDWDARYQTGQTPWDSGVASAQLERMLAEYQITPRRALELGCGTGTNAVYLAGKGFQVTAVDIAPLAIERAKARAEAAGVEIDFKAADLLEKSTTTRLLADGPFPLIFDRGVYHCLREVNLAAFQRAIGQLAAPGGHYLLLAGNANEQSPPDQGPPRVSATDLIAELSPMFELVELREFRFDGVVIEGQDVRPLAWSALWRRK